MQGAANRKGLPCVMHDARDAVQLVLNTCMGCLLSARAIPLPHVLPAAIADLLKSAELLEPAPLLPLAAAAPWPRCHSTPRRRPAWPLLGRQPPSALTVRSPGRCRSLGEILKVSDNKVTHHSHQKGAFGLNGDVSFTREGH